MEVCVEVDPIRTLLVLGPHITAQCLSESRDHSVQPAFLEYRRIVEGGIKKSLDLDDLVSNEAVRRKETLLLNAYELEPAFAAHKVFETLKEHSEYEAWMKETFQSSKEFHFDGSSSPTLQYILSLRREGVRLVYTHYDDLMARALGLPVVLMEDEEGARKWSQGYPALLHLHGAFSRPQSMKMDCLCYKTQVGEGKAADILREQFQSRAVVFAGFDEPFVDPLLSKVLSTFAAPTTMPTSFPLLLTGLQRDPVSSGCLAIKVQKSNLRSVLKISSTSLGVAPINDASHPVSVRLLSTDKQTTQDIIDVLSHFPSILPRVAEEGLVLNLQMSRPSLHRMWAEVFIPSLFSASCALAAIHLEGSFMVRVYNTAAYNPSSGQLRITPPISSSLWKQVAPTSIPPISSRPPLPHFAIPSSLIGSTTQQLKFVNAHMSMDRQPILHEKVRRIQSENDGLLFKDHLESKKNGLLTHQQSAPLFPFVPPQGSVIQTPRLTNLRPSMFPVQGPPMLVNFDQKQGDAQTQLKVEQKVSEVPVEQHYQMQPEPMGSGKEEKGFEKKKSKFIREAMQWSKKLEDRLVVKSEHVDVISRTSNIYTQPLASPQQTSPHNSTHSPILTNHKHLSTFLMGSPQTCGMYTILPHNPALPSLAGGVLPTQVPLLTAMQPLSGGSQSPNDGGRALSCVLPRTIPVTTPTLNSEQKFVYMMQDGTLIATPILQERQLGAGLDAMNRLDNSDAVSNPPVRSPKRTGSPNSDMDIMTYSARKRRRSSSLPGVTNRKSPSSNSESSSSPTTPPPAPPTLYPITSPSDIKVETTHFLTLPQITSPSTGHYNPNLFFSGMQMPVSLTSSDLNRMKMDGDVSSEDKLGENDTTHPPSPDNQVHPVPVGRGPIQLWQFLLDLLLSTDKSHLIQWTGNGYEFRIIQPEEIAKLWGARKNKPRMNYDKLSRGLRYYYSKGIMDKVPGKKLTFKYTCNIQQYMAQRSASSVGSPQVVVSNNSL